MRLEIEEKLINSKENILIIHSLLTESNIEMSSIDKLSINTSTNNFGLSLNGILIGNSLNNVVGLNSLPNQSLK